MTNNQAEYYGAIFWLNAARSLQIKKLTLIMDSELVIRQLRWEYRVKDPLLKTLFCKIQGIIQAFEEIEYISVLRDKNTFADTLVNQAIDDQYPLCEDTNMHQNFSLF